MWIEAWIVYRARRCREWLKDLSELQISLLTKLLYLVILFHFQITLIHKSYLILLFRSFLSHHTQPFLYFFPHYPHRSDNHHTPSAVRRLPAPSSGGGGLGGRMGGDQILCRIWVLGKHDLGSAGKENRMRGIATGRVEGRVPGTRQGWCCRCWMMWGGNGSVLFSGCCRWWCLGWVVVG